MVKSFNDFIRESRMNENQHNELEELIKAFIENQCKGEHPDHKLVEKAIDKLKELATKTSTTLLNINVQDGSCSKNHICMDPVTNSLGKNIGKVEVGKVKES